ncbi:MAG: DNRLRE domain-containing protein [Chloroflexota bacterium]
MKKFQPNASWLPVLCLLLVIMGLLQAAPGTAQEDPTPPPRNTDRVAPEREPQVLSREETPDGVNTVVGIPANADTYLASGRPNENFGSDALFLGYNLAGSQNFGAQRMLLRFDVDSSIPTGAIINSATLRLYLSFSSPANDTAMGTVLRRLASPWNEHTVTWNTEPVWTDVDDTVFIGSALTWYEWDMTALVENWTTAVYPNDGVEIIGDETIQQRERAFHSRETPTSLYPLLVVDYFLSSDQEPPEVTVSPLPDYSRRNFTVSWTGTDPGGSGLDYYDVQVRADSGDWQTWLAGTTQTEAEYANGENGRLYQFRARGVDNAGNIEPFGAAEAETTVDSQAPTTTVDPLPPLTHSATFNVSWTGADAGSGIQYYDVQVRFNDGPWSLWLPQTLSTSATYNAAADGIYAFEARAVDNLDQAELFTNTAEASLVVDNKAPFVEPQLWLPIIFK